MSLATLSVFYPPRGMTLGEVKKVILRHWQASGIEESSVTASVARITKMHEFERCLYWTILELNADESKAIQRKVSSALGIEIHTLHTQ
ncbi:hypothetical protein VCHA53O466_50462 [Vibrio chagasii]|nr:hypothetical protein VCHA53O466_50462 [Vibrio chagasii]